MRRVFQVLSWAALALTIVPAFMFFHGTIDITQMKLWMLVATVAWFVATPLWMGRDKEARGES
jgi:hypothetical protein